MAVQAGTQPGTGTRPAARTRPGAHSREPGPGGMSRSGILATAFMFVCAIYFLLPAWWLVVSSTKGPSTLYASEGFWFSQLHFVSNLTGLFRYDGGIYWHWLVNTLLYAGVGALCATLLASAAGYALAKYEFRGRQLVFSVILGGVLVPGTALALPLYLLMSKVSLTNTYWAVFLPSIVSPFGVFLARVYAAASIPDELIEAGPDRRRQRGPDLPDHGVADHVARTRHYVPVPVRGDLEQLLPPAGDALQYPPVSGDPRPLHLEQPVRPGPATGQLRGHRLTHLGPPAHRRLPLAAALLEVWPGRRERAAVMSGEVGGIAYGSDYNPEQWPESTWAEDVRLMAEAGVSLVTVGVFSWARLQRAPGELTAGWLDKVLDLLAGSGIRVDLATATASPPAWLIAAHPEILPVTADGRRLSPGARQHYCPSAPAFREAAADLAGRMAQRYADHPAVAMWHVGNEYGCHVPACYCDQSAEAFRRWLQARYHGLDELNEAWGGAVWSQDYTCWDQVGPPRAAPTFINPAQQLDFARFSSDELLACYRAERAVLAAHSPGKPVTTNFMGLFRPVDQFRWSPELDVVSVDSYPDPADAEAYLVSAMTGDLTRSVGGGRAWLLMEQTPNAVNWRAVNVPKAPGQYRALSLQAVARGADAVLSFQWRAAATGAEKFHSGMLPHAGTGSRVWREVVRLGADLRRLAPVAGRPVPGRRRLAARLGELVGARAGRASQQPAAPDGIAQRVLPSAVRGGRDRRLRASRE